MDQQPVRTAEVVSITRACSNVVGLPEAVGEFLSEPDAGTESGSHGVGNHKEADHGACWNRPGLESKLDLHRSRGRDRQAEDAVDPRPRRVPRAPAAERGRDGVVRREPPGGPHGARVGTRSARRAHVARPNTRRLDTEHQDRPARRDEPCRHVVPARRTPAGRSTSAASSRPRRSICCAAGRTSFR